MLFNTKKTPKQPCPVCDLDMTNHSLDDLKKCYYKLQIAISYKEYIKGDSKDNVT